MSESGKSMAILATTSPICEVGSGIWRAISVVNVSKRVRNCAPDGARVSDPPASCDTTLSKLLTEPRDIATANNKDKAYDRSTAVNNVSRAANGARHRPPLEIPATSLANCIMDSTVSA
jgi:hypothetical protein